MGAIKTIIFGMTDVYTWDSTLAFAIIAVICVAISIGVLIAIALWLRDCLRGPQPLRRIARDAAFWVAMLGSIFFLDAIEKRYQVFAFWIVMGILVTGGLVFAWWDDKRRQKQSASGHPRAEHHRKVVEELSKDPADAEALEHYLKRRAAQQ